MTTDNARKIKTVDKNAKAIDVDGRNSTAGKNVYAMVAGRQGIKYIYSITVCPRGQDAASIIHHCANTTLNFKDRK